MIKINLASKAAFAILFGLPSPGHQFLKRSVY